MIPILTKIIVIMISAIIKQPYPSILRKHIKKENR